MAEDRQIRLRKAGIAARAAIVLFAALSAAAFWVVSGAVSDEPAPPSYPGWVALVHNVNALDTSQVRLVVQTLQPGGLGQAPALEYSVTACGTTAFHGELLAGGSARLTNPVVEPSNVPHQVSVLRNASLVGSNGSERLGRVLAVELSLPPMRCVSKFTGSPQQQFGGAEISVAGLAMGPVQHQTRILGLWDAPRSTQAWPLIGTFPDVAPGIGGDWRVTGIPGLVSRPPRAYFELEVTSLTADAAVEESRPPLGSGNDADVSDLVWNEIAPFQATARIVHLTLLSTWQEWQVIVTIWLTLAFALGAAILYELVPAVRARAPATEPLAIAPAPRAPAHGERHAASAMRSHSGTWWARTVIAAFVICRELVRRR